MDENKFFYANGAEVSISAYDITFKFMRNGAPPSKIGDTPDSSPLTRTGEAKILDFLSVGMSLSHAKTLLPTLLELLSIYEKQFGEVPLPPDKKQKWDEMISTIKAFSNVSH